ncbi:MAG: hypothetical protein Q4B84_04385 [Clostridia bacterium]|nr:hypothetical protein [Clostridia bacterium]
MEIEKLLNELEDMIEVSWHLPMSGGKSLLDAKEIQRIVEDLRLKLPKEIIQARKIIDEKEQMFENAKIEIEKMVEASKEKIQEMVNNSEITEKAKVLAGDIISDARSKSNEIQQSANQYVDNVMKDLEKMMESKLSDIRKARTLLNKKRNS